MNVSVFCMVYNEEIIIPYMIKHYRDRFPFCKIVIFDNQSTDKTADIARSMDCEVIEYTTGGQVDDDKLRQLKNNCWKKETNEWALVCDADEFLDINDEQLAQEDARGTTIIRAEAYNMVNLEDNYDVNNITHGIRNTSYDKPYLFKRAVISEMNYVHGGHRATPVGQIKYSDTAYKTYHYININPELTFKKHQYTRDRLSEKNKKMGWGVQYFKEVSLEEVKGWYASARSGASKVK